MTRNNADFQQPVKLYHGTNADLKPGDVILPASARNSGVSHWNTGDEAFAANDPHVALEFAHEAAKRADSAQHYGVDDLSNHTKEQLKSAGALGTRRRVYQVEPLDTPKEQPLGGLYDSVNHALDDIENIKKDKDYYPEPRLVTQHTSKAGFKVVGEYPLDERVASGRDNYVRNDELVQDYQQESLQHEYEYNKTLNSLGDQDDALNQRLADVAAKHSMRQKSWKLPYTTKVSKGDSGDGRPVSAELPRRTEASDFSSFKGQNTLLSPQMDVFKG